MQKLKSFFVPLQREVFELCGNGFFDRFESSDLFVLLSLYILSFDVVSWTRYLSFSTCLSENFFLCVPLLIILFYSCLPLYHFGWNRASELLSLNFELEFYLFV